MKFRVDSTAGILEATYSRVIIGGGISSILEGVRWEPRQQSLFGTGYSHGGPAAAAYSTTHGVSSSKKRGKGKGKGKEQYHDSEEDGDYDTRDIGYGASQPLEETEYDDRPEDDAYYSRRTKSAHSSCRHYDQEFEVDSDSVDAVEPDRNNYTLGGSSSTPVEGTYADDPSEMTTEPNDYISSANSPEDAADLDPRYRIEPSHRFQPGEVFKILWPEPSGRSTGKLPTLSDKREVPDRYGGSIFVGFRRFIVVASDSGHCTCVPISTYGGKGCKKKGIKPEKHGIITEKGTKAKRLDGEPKLGYPPVRMKITVHSEQIARESRVNYSKLVTIEHNVKVFFIGSIYADDYDLVTDAVNDCWEKKTFYKKKH
ncbi:uncharacterized protein DNG_01862 [Cephalotrichum gorgonifer]|uniref:DUF6590 domain-containing protein n=1 Tax=Cephalotrichum gorgonifer TaxID=2041049 RepID=A0AAE8MRF1_9PEZI|nr:uncharacterized protein DNG_01862 [Cephalotrichum gorgonifer]